MVRSCNVFPHPDEPPIITVHPQDLKNIVPSKPLTFTVEATGTEPLSYQWEMKTRNGKGGWQLCDVESFPGANSSTLTISSVQKANEYRCTVSNCAGRETSQCATLTVGKNHYEKALQFICGSVSSSTYWMLIFIALSIVPGHNSSEHFELPEAYQYIYGVQTITAACCFGSLAADPPRITTHPT